MKKLLALVLALVMVMSLSVVSTSAAFADAASIEHTEAVEVLNSLGVIGGKENNNFDPTGNVKRSEMAKMVALIMLGDVDDSAFKGAPTDLTDIDGHWAEGWIKFCVSQGIVGGRGNGKFDPDANVTAAEAAKMLLVAIGYNATVQGYTGSQWQVNVTRDAQISGFYKQLSGLGANKALTRDEAAQMIYNAADVDQTSHTEALNSNGERITTYTPKDPVLGTLLESAYNAVKVEDQYLVDVKLQTGGDYKGTYTVTLSNRPNKSGTLTAYAKVQEDYSDLLGQKVTLRYADLDNSAGWTVAKDEIIGIYAQNQNNEAGPFAFAQLSRKADYKIKAAGTEYSFEDTTGVNIYTVDTDGTVATIAQATSIANAAAVPTNMANYLLGVIGTITAGAPNTYATPYSTVKFIDNDVDGDYDTIVITRIAAAKLSFADASRVIAGSVSYTKADNTVDANLAKDDYAQIAYDFATAKTTLTKIEKATGTVESRDATDDPVKATISGVTVADPTTALPSINAVVTLAAGTAYDYYALNGWLVDAKATTSSSMENLAFVGAVTNAAQKQVRIYFTDGTNKLVTVDDSASTSVAYGSVAAGTFYTVSETSSGYRFTDISAKLAKSDVYTDVFYDPAARLASNTTMTAGTTATGGATAADVLSINDDAVVFVRSSDGLVKVITGEEVASLTAATTTGVGTVSTDTTDGTSDNNTAMFYKSINGLRKVTVASLYQKTAGFAGWAVSSDRGNYAMVTSDAVTLDGATRYTIWNGSENLTVMDKTNTTATTITKFSIVNYSSIDADGYIKDADITTYSKTQIVYNSYAGPAPVVGPTSVAAFEKDTNDYYDLFLAGDTTSGNKIDTDNKTLFWTIDSGASSADTIGLSNSATVKTADKVSGVTVQNVIVFTNSATYAKIVIFDTANRLVTKAATTVSLTTLHGFTVTDVDGNGVTTATSLKAGDILTVKNDNTGAAITIPATSRLINAATGTAADGLSVANNSTVTLVVDGTGAPTL